METSKKITWTFIALYIITLGLTIFFSIKGYNIEHILQYVHQIMVVIVFSYFGKAGVENWKKIQASSDMNQVYNKQNYNDYNQDY